MQTDIPIARFVVIFVPFTTVRQRLKRNSDPAGKIINEAKQTKNDTDL